VLPRRSISPSRVVAEEVKGAELQDFFVGQACRAIESGTEEFAAPDAVIEQPVSRDA
jgi:hypothetical protein